MGKWLGLSDHALQRYNERVSEQVGLTDKNDIIAFISNSIKKYVDVLGDGIYPVYNRVVAVVRDRTIITIYDRNNKDDDYGRTLLRNRR